MMGSGREQLGDREDTIHEPGCEREGKTSLRGNPKKRHQKEKKMVCLERRKAEIEIHYLVKQSDILILFANTDEIWL